MSVSVSAREVLAANQSITPPDQRHADRARKIIDGACARSVCGDKWWNGYLRELLHLGPASCLEMLVVDGRCRDGRKVVCRRACRVHGVIAGKPVRITLCVIEGNSFSCLLTLPDLTDPRNVFSPGAETKADAQSDHTQKSAQVCWCAAPSAGRSGPPPTPRKNRKPP